MAPHEHGGCGLEFDGLEIPRERAAGRGRRTQDHADPSRSRAADALHAMAGFSKRCMEIAQALPTAKVGIKLGDRESVQIKLGDVAQQIQIGRLLTMHAAWMLDRVAAPASLDGQGPGRRHAAQGRRRCDPIAGRPRLLAGFYRAVDARSARSARLVDGASEVHMMVLARFMREEGRDFWQWGPGEGRRNVR